MPDVRYRMWTKNVGKPKISLTPPLRSLPPTTEEFIEHVKRAHSQCCIWKSAMDQSPPQLNPLKYGWFRDDTRKSLEPVMLPDNVTIAPDSVLQMIRCGSLQQTKCSIARCECFVLKFSCTIFCGCNGDGSCVNSLQDGGNVWRVWR